MSNTIWIGDDETLISEDIERHEDDGEPLYESTQQKVKELYIDIYGSLNLYTEIGKFNVHHVIPLDTFMHHMSDSDSFSNLSNAIEKRIEQLSDMKQSLKKLQEEEEETGR